MRALLLAYIFLVTPQVVFGEPCDERGSYEDLKSYFDKHVKQGEHTKAQLCMDKALRTLKHRKNMDIFELSIRSMIWQQKFDQALSLLKEWRQQDTGYYLLLGDLYWIKQDMEMAKSAFLKAQTLSGEPLSPVYLKKLIIVLFKSNEKEIARGKLKQALIQHPNDVNLRKLKSFFSKAKEMSITGEFRYYTESQSQSREEEEIEGSQRIQQWRYMIGAIRSQKNFPFVKYSDYILSFKLGKQFEAHDFELQYKYVFSPDFYYKYSAIGMYSFTLFEKFVLNADCQFRKYRDDSLYLFKVGVDFYIRSLLFSLKVAYDLKSFLLKARYYFEDRFFNEVWWASGNTESSRPYLVDSEEVSFNSVGYKISYMFYDYVSANLYYERHTQQAYDYNLIGVGLGYSF